MADDTNILPNDQNFVRAAGFESSSTPGLVMAGQIDEITGRILVDNAGGGGAATEITVENEATDTTCFPVFVTAATGDLEPKSNTGLTFNSNTSNLQSTILSSSSLTASEIVITDASKNLVSASVATYPSLTELTYLKGVTSAIQTQLNAKQATITFGTGVETALGVNIGSAGAPVLFNGALGTPSSGTATNLSGTAASLTAGAVTGYTPAGGSLTLAGADALTLTTSAATNVTLPTTGTLATLAGTETFTNKRITKRTGTTTSSATPTINTDNVDEYYITAQTEAITSFTTNLSGTPTLGQTLFISVIGTAARAITWGASFANGPVALPTTTVTTTQLSTLLKWDGSIWRCYATGSTV